MEALVSINLRVKLGEFSWEILPPTVKDKVDAAIRGLDEAAQSLSSASFQMGCIHLYGHGRPRNHIEAKAWFRRALSQDPMNAGAAYELALLMEDASRTEGVSWNGGRCDGRERSSVKMSTKMSTEVRSLHEQAARNNHAGSMKRLGDVAREEGDLHRASELYTAACRQGAWDATFALADLHRYGSCGNGDWRGAPGKGDDFPANHALAEQLYEHAAKLREEQEGWRDMGAIHNNHLNPLEGMLGWTGLLANSRRNESFAGVIAMILSLTVAAVVVVVTTSLAVAVASAYQ